MNRKTTSRKEKDDILCADVDDGTVMEYVSVLKHGPGVTQEKREIARILKSYLALRRKARASRVAMKQNGIRNCDVMTTATALRKGWERRCEYGKPCCPFEYAIDLFDRKEGLDD